MIDAAAFINAYVANRLKQLGLELFVEPALYKSPNCMIVSARRFSDGLRSRLCIGQVVRDDQDARRLAVRAAWLLRGCYRLNSTDNCTGAKKTGT